MGIVLRQANTGAIITGTVGQTLVANADGTWSPGSAGTALPDGTYAHEPLAWDGTAWVPATRVDVDNITGHSGGALSIASAGPVNIGGGGGIALAVDPGQTLLLDAPTTQIRDGLGNTLLLAGTTGIGFYGAPEHAKPTITGAKGGNAALTSLLTQLAALGLVTDSTT
jgi:hypothetical protein